MHDWQSEVRARLAPLNLKPEREADIVDEISQHLAERYREATQSGVSPDEATRVALAEFRAGNMLAQRIAALRQVHAPQPLPVGALGQHLLADLWVDLRLAARMLRRSPGFTIVAALTLALGIGINTTIFSGISGLLLRPLPYVNAERLVDIQPASRSASKAVLVDAREQFDSFDSISGYSLWTFTLMTERGAEQLSAVRATADLFDVLGAPPLLGRALIPADGIPGAEPVIVVSYDFWQRRFGGDPDVVGRTLEVTFTGSGGTPRIVGVMPREFAFPTADAEMWAPISVSPADTDYNTSYLELLGRLAPGVDVAAAERGFVGTVAARCAEQPNCDETAVRANSRVLPLRESLVGPVRPILLVLFGAVGFVLLIACANVANLLLTRAAVRERELAIRTALGAGRGRVARQLLAESLLIAAVGGVLGILAALWGADAFRAALPAGLVGVNDIGIDLSVLAFASAAVVLVALLAGLLPAFGAARANLHAALLDRAGGAQRARRRALGALVVAEFALALVLTVGAGLMIRSFANLSNENPGFSDDGVLSLRISTPQAFDAAANGRFWFALLERVGALSGVENAGAIHLLPLAVGNWAAPLIIDGRPLADGETPRVIAWRSVTPGYFETLRIRLVRGRLFTDREHEAEERLVLINETAAAHYFPNEDPIGRQVRTTFEGEAWATVVGIVGDTKDQTLASPTAPQLYRLRAPYIGSMTLMVRTEGDPLLLAAPIRAIVREIEDDAPGTNVQLLDRVAADSIAQPRLLTGLLFGFGAIALLLGALGLYGVMAHGTVQRTREFGVRIALGARTSDVLGLVARDAIRLAVIGVGLGLAGAFALTRLLESQLYGVAPVDPFVFAGAAVLLAAVALAAALAPALRAARTDPMVALRWE